MKPVCLWYVWHLGGWGAVRDPVPTPPVDPAAPSSRSVEVTDVGGALLLACTACWDSKAAPGAGPSATDAGAALATALTTLRDVRGAAAPPSLAAFAGGRGAVSHSPRRAEWEAAVTLAQELLDEESAEGEAAPCTPSLLDPGTALENYIAGGQQGLDDLLEALEGTPALGAPATVRQMLTTGRVFSNPPSLFTPCQDLTHTIKSCNSHREGTAAPETPTAAPPHFPRSCWRGAPSCACPAAPTRWPC